MAENEVKGKEIKGKAPREQLFGRIFGLATLARSKRLEVCSLYGHPTFFYLIYVILLERCSFHVKIRG